jgi:hypothetical protein
MAQVIGLILKYCEKIFNLGSKMKLLSFKTASLLLMAFGVTQLSFDSKALAQNSQRYPTDVEWKSFYIEFTQSIRKAANNMVDTRSSAEKKSIQSFVKAWSVVEPESAPFLGHWIISLDNYYSQMIVYPSKTKNRVCIIQITLGRGQRFWLGYGSKGKIYNDEFPYNILLRQGRYLGEYQNPFPYHSPKPLKHPEEVLPRMVDVISTQNILQKYRDAGCTNSLPNK